MYVFREKPSEKPKEDKAKSIEDEVDELLLKKK